MGRKKFKTNERTIFFFMKTKYEGEGWNELIFCFGRHLLAVDLMLDVVFVWE